MVNQYLPMEDLEDRLGLLTLTEEEVVPIDINGEEIENAQRKGKRYLIGKVCMERVINKATIETTMAKVWRLSKLAIFQVVG